MKRDDAGDQEIEALGGRLSRFGAATLYPTLVHARYGTDIPLAKRLHSPIVGTVTQLLQFNDLRPRNCVDSAE